MYRVEGILGRTHLRFFTEKSFRRLLEESGLEIVELRGINGLQLDSVAPKIIIKKILTMVFGEDTAHLQYGFKTKYL